MIYEIRAGNRTFITCDTSVLANTGIYYGTANLPVRDSHDYTSGFLNYYIYPGTRTVYVPSSGSVSAQYLTIVSVTPRYDLYYGQTFSGSVGGGMFELIFLGVIAICSLLRIFFRR